MDELALDVVRSARSELIDAPAVTLDTWPVGDAVVILLRYGGLCPHGGRTDWRAQLHHVELTDRIASAIRRTAPGRLELRGSSFNPHRRLSALAFGIPDARQSCPGQVAPAAH
jgi:hypothetical protein